MKEVTMVMVCASSVDKQRREGKGEGGKWVQSEGTEWKTKLYSVIL